MIIHSFISFRVAPSNFFEQPFIIERSENKTSTTNSAMFDCIIPLDETDTLANGQSLCSCE